MKPAEKTLNIRPDNDLRMSNRHNWELSAEKHRVETVLTGMIPGGDIVIRSDETYIAQDAMEVLSDTRELYRNLEKQYGWIDSPKTKAVYGFVSDGATHRMSNGDEGYSIL